MLLAETKPARAIGAILLLCLLLSILWSLQALHALQQQTQSAELLAYSTLLAQPLRQLLGGMCAAGLLALLLAWYVGTVLAQRQGLRLRSTLQLQTDALLRTQEELNDNLERANATLRVSEAKLAVTLNSIGDGVIATDMQARVTLLNPVAQQLTGWTEAQALGRSVDDVFRIISKTTRQPAHLPVAAALADGTAQGLANHTVLLSRDGPEFDIADSCAPIRDANAHIVGAVLVFRNITAQYAVEQALRDSSALNQTVLNTMVDGIVTMLADSGQIATTNPAFNQMFGYAAGALVGTDFTRLIAGYDSTASSDLQAYFAANNLAHGCESRTLGLRRDGSTFPLEIVGSAMQQGNQRYFTAILCDISVRRSAEEARRKSEARLGSIVATVADAVISVDAGFHITLFNSAAEDMFGLSSEEVMGTLLERLVPPRHQMGGGIALQTTGRAAEIHGLHANGREFPMRATVTQLEASGERVLTVVLRDLTERQVLDQELHDTNVALHRARFSAEKANLAKSEFMSNMSHELRSPLNAILGFAQLMETGLPEPTDLQKSNIAQILRAGWYLLELINEILDLSLIESGRITMSMEPIDLADLLVDCDALIQAQAVKSGITLTLHIPDVPVSVHADRTRVKQVLVNLLSNAVKYNRPQGRIDVYCTCGPLLADGAAQSVRISVRDTGEGLAPAKLAQLFQPFNRLGQEAGSEEGSGIGLVVSKRLMELMDGTLGVDSVVGVGSEFWFELDRVAPQQLHIGAVMAHPPAPLLAGQARKTLLYIEDNQANMDLVAQLVARRPDIRLLGARDGLQGLALARKHLPDVILMDINLPGISGLQTLHLMQQDPTIAHIPALALSANAMERDIQRGLEAGFLRYLTKPIRIDAFMAALDAALLANANPPNTPLPEETTP